MMLLGCRAAKVTHASAQVALNKGLDFVPLDGVLLELRLPPEALEVPVPRCLLEARASVRHRPPVQPAPSPCPAHPTAQWRDPSCTGPGPVSGSQACYRT